VRDGGHHPAGERLLVGAEPRDEVADVVRQVAVRDGDALRQSGRARGVDDVDEVVDGRRLLWRVSALAVELRAVAVEADDLAVEGGEVGEHRLLRDDDAGPRLRELVAEARRRM